MQTPPIAGCSSISARGDRDRGVLTSATHETREMSRYGPMLHVGPKARFKPTRREYGRRGKIPVARRDCMLEADVNFSIKEGLLLVCTIDGGNGVPFLGKVLGGCWQLSFDEVMIT